MGIAVCGSGIGTFIMAPLTTYLIEKFSWKGASLIQAGIMLNSILGGALFRPLHLNEETCDLKKEKEIMLLDRNMEKRTENCRENGISTYQLSKSDGHLFSNCEKDTGSRSRSFTNLNMNNINCVETDISNLTESYVGASSQKEVFTKGTHSNSRMIILYRRCFETLGLVLCTNPAFALYVLSSSCTSLSIATTMTFLPDRAKDSGISETDVSFLLSAMGIANTIIRVVFGWISGQRFANPSIIYVSALLINGMVTLPVAFVDDYAFLLSYAIIFGMCFGIYVLLMSIVLVEFVGIEQLNNSFGLMLLIKGIAVVAGTPVIGWLYDVTGSYVATFYTAGAIMLISALIFFIGYILKIRRDYVNPK